MDLNALEDFQLVALHGGFGKASRASGRAKATLSRRVADLEEELGVRLIERGGQRLALTDAGRSLIGSTEGPLREIGEAFAAARDGMGAPRGRLRITAPQLFSQVALGGLIARFVALYPEVRVETVAEDRFVDLVDEHFDVAIRVNPTGDGELVGRCFARDRLVIAASLTIARPEDWDGYPIAVPAVMAPNHRDGDVWRVRDGSLVLAPQPTLRVASLLMARDAMAAGAGVALLPQSILGSLVRSGKAVIWGIVGKEVELWVLHTSRRLQSPKVRAFVDFIVSQYPNGHFDAGAV